MLFIFPLIVGFLALTGILNVTTFVISGGRTKNTLEFVQSLSISAPVAASLRNATHNTFVVVTHVAHAALKPFSKRSSPSAAVPIVAPIPVTSGGDSSPLDFFLATRPRLPTFFNTSVHPVCTGTYLDQDPLPTCPIATATVDGLSSSFSFSIFDLLLCAMLSGIITLVCIWLYLKRGQRKYCNANVGFASQV